MGRNSRTFSRLKIAVFAPIPSPRETTTARAKPGLLPSFLSTKRRSDHTFAICLHLNPALYHARLCGGEISQLFCDSLFPWSLQQPLWAEDAHSELVLQTE